MTYRRIHPAALCVASIACALVGCAPSTQSGSDESGQSAVVSEGGVTLRQSLTPLEPTVADTITLTLTIEAPQETEIIWPDVAGAIPDTLEFTRERTTEPPGEPSGDVLRTRQYEFAPVLAGELAIPPLPVLIGDDVILETQEIAIQVRSMLEESADFAPRKDVAAPPPDYRSWALMAGGAVGGVVLLAIVGALAVRRLVRREAPPSRPAHEVALERLQRLLDGDLLDRGRIELFLSEVTDILRHYIEDRFSIHAPAQTTDEFLDEVRRGDAMTVEQSAEIGAFLRRCDLVKFARADASRDEARRAADMVHDFIMKSAAMRDADPHASAHSSAEGAAS